MKKKKNQLVPLTQLLYRQSVAQVHKINKIKKYLQRFIGAKAREHLGMPWRYPHHLILRHRCVSTPRTSQYFFAILLMFERSKRKLPISFSSLSIKRRIVEVSLAKLAKESMNKNCVAERPLFLLFLKQHFCLILDNGLLIKISTKGKQLNNT